MENRDKKNHEIVLTKSQENVLNEILDFIDNPDKRVFILKGYAGTGKTTLMRFLIKHLNVLKRNYRLLASTGRAAKVLANLSGMNGNTCTIHSMIYAFNGLNKEFDEHEEIRVDQNGQLFLVFETATLDMVSTPEMIYIIDESSMISDVASKDVTQAKFGSGRLLKDLLDYDQRSGSKFIFVGDPCQLPPLEEYYSPALMKEYIEEHYHLGTQETKLTEIMRQSDNNGIVNASKLLRGFYAKAPADKSHHTQQLWGFLPFRQFQNIQYHVNLDMMIDQYVEKLRTKGYNSSICICRSNKACGDLSTIIRNKLGHTSGRLEVGDLLMVVQNNRQTGLMNGDMVVVEEISNRTEVRALMTFRQVKVKELFTEETFSTLILEELLYQSRLNLNSHQQQELFIDFIYRMRAEGITQKNNRGFYQKMMDDPYLNALRCVYGYAITCHKSQGGEWDEVFVHVPRNITLNPTKETYQWLYTAITRTRATLHLVDDFYIK